MATKIDLGRRCKPSQMKMAVLCKVCRAVVNRGAGWNDERCLGKIVFRCNFQ